jgi:hypothetical protein
MTMMRRAVVFFSATLLACGGSQATGAGGATSICADGLPTCPLCDLDICCYSPDGGAPIPIHCQDFDAGGVGGAGGTPNDGGGTGGTGLCNPSG